jgi:hypothetical protein
MVPKFPVSLLVTCVAALSSACQAAVHEEHLTIQDAPANLAIDVGSGDVRLVGSELPDVRVSARIQGDSNHANYALINDGLSLFDDCNEEPCSVDLSLTIPAHSIVNLHTGSGDLVLESLLGELTLETGSGDVAGSALGGSSIDAKTGSGDVELELSRSIARVQVRSGSGDVALSVPRGNYRIQAATGSGDPQLVGVSNDATAAGILEVQTGSGDVLIRGE